MDVLGTTPTIKGDFGGYNEIYNQEHDIWACLKMGNGGPKCQFLRGESENHDKP